jgi:hypothetical protein
MKISKKSKLVLSLALLMLLITSGIGREIHLMDKRTEHERQVAFLKEHEAEMTEYIKSQNEKIETVEYDWNSIEVGTIGNGTPQGAGRSLQLFGKFNGIQDSGFRLNFEVKKDGKVDFESMILGQPFRINGRIYE